MGQKINKNNFVIQGSILAFAGIMVRVIGLIYRIPLNRILGTEGIGYYSTAYDVYNMLILLSSQSMPLAVSKIVSEKLEKKEYKNAHKVFKGALAYAIILGVSLGLFTFLGADWLAVHFCKTPPVAIVLKVLAPTLTVACILGVLRGYFQGMGNMAPTAISQVFEQIANAFVSVIAAYELGAYGYSLSKIQKDAVVLKNSYAAAGGTLGTFMGAVTALLVLCLVYWNSRLILKNRRLKDKHKTTDDYSVITKIIIFTITPVLISTTIYNIGNFLDGVFYQNIMDIFFKVPYQIRSANYGIYSGYYRLLTTMPIAIASSLSTAIVPSLVRSYVAGDSSVVKNKIDLALKFSMIVAFPCGMGLSVLGGPINTLLFGEKAASTSGIMIFSVCTVVAFSLSTISNAILQGINKLNVPIKNSAISLAIHIAILFVLLTVFKLDIYAVVIGDFLFGATVSVLNAFSIQKYLQYRQNLRETFMKPLICSSVMGAGCLAAYYGAKILIHSNFICTFVGMFIAVIIYTVMLIVTKTITESELLSIPKGTAIISLLKKVHLL